MFVTERDHRAALTLVGDAAAAVSRAEFVGDRPAWPATDRGEHRDQLRRSRHAHLAMDEDRRLSDDAVRPARCGARNTPPAGRASLGRLATTGLRRHRTTVTTTWRRPARASPFYADFYRPRGLRHAEYLVITRTTGHAIGISAGRSERDYSDREHDLLEHVRVPLGRAWRVAWRTERLYAAAGRDLDDVPAELDILTDAERHVAALVMHGLDNAGIAEVLDVSVKAVEQHLTHIYRRLGVRSRTQLVIRIRQSSDAESVKVVKAGGNCAAAVAGSCS